MLHEINTLTKEHFVSLFVLGVFLIMSIVFPVNTSSLLEAVTVFLVFLCILPTIYTLYILKRSPSELWTVPFTLKYHPVSQMTGIVIGLTFAFLLHLSPYLEVYKSFAQPFFLEFKNFLIFELLFVTPLLMIATYFSIIIVGALHLPRNITYIMSTIVLSSLMFTFFDFPTYVSFVVVGCILLSYVKMKSINIISLFISLRIFFLGLDTLIANTILP